MKTINYRGGVVTFRIPSSWKEEYSDTDGGTFFEDKPDSGTFRLKIITVRSPSEITHDSALAILEMLKQARGKGERMKDGNALAFFEEVTMDRGHKIKIICWILSNPLPPNHARIATFSYTILQSQEADPLIVQTLELLDREIRASVFSTAIDDPSK